MARVPTIRGTGSDTSMGYGSSFDKSQWDRLYKTITGDAPGGILDEMAGNQILDPAVERTAHQAKEWIKEDTPVDTGTLQASHQDRRSAPADWYVETNIHYAPVVEGRPPGGPATRHGAMYSQNIDRIEMRLRDEIEQELRARGVK